MWRSVIEITIDIENMNVFPRDAPERLSRSDHDAAIAADQERNMPRLLQVRHDPRADAVPGDPWARPVPDRRDAVMGKIAGNCDVPVIQGVAADCLEPGQQLNVTVGLSVVFAARVQRAGAKGNAQDVVGPLPVVEVR
jgi:hypothetical protein